MRPLAVVLAWTVLAALPAEHAWGAPISGYRADGDDHVHLNVAWNSAPIVEAGYGHHLRIDGLDRRLDLEASLILPIVLVPDADAFGLEPSARVVIAENGPWGAAARFGLPVRTGDNRTFRFASLAAHATLTAGYFGPRLFVAVEGAYTCILTTYIAASDETRANDPGFRNGFYAITGGYVDLSLMLGARLGSTLEVGVRAGRRATQSFAPPPLLPFVAEGGVSVAF